MLTFNALSLLEIRQRLETCLAGSIGQYTDGSPAIWVLDRPLPDTQKVKVAGKHQPVVPALEVVINPHHGVSSIASNFGFGHFAEVITIYLIWHDQRQSSRLPALSVVAAFTGYTPELTSLEASELHLRQHVLKITNRVTVPLC